MGKISEFFGLNCENRELDFKQAMNNQMCPYTNKICTKMRKSESEIKIGTCSVKFQNQNIIICPFRLLEHNQIFIDCLHLLTMHEPGNELYLIPEVQIPGGHVDYFLVSAKDKKVKDFVGIELQTLDTTGTVWPDRQKFLNSVGISVPQADLDNNKTYGMNWKMTLKTILIQMHHKSETFENLNKHFVLIVQKPLFERMKTDFDFTEINGVRLGDSVHIHSYNFEEKENQYVLSLGKRLSTDSAGIAKCLGLNANKKVELEEMIKILEPKLIEANRLRISI
jgi:hypothetical protein|nr:MAG TPA: restriction endonuclease [Caudoviricetes sp.]